MRSFGTWKTMLGTVIVCAAMLFTASSALAVHVGERFGPEGPANAESCSSSVSAGSNGKCGTYLCEAADSAHYNGPTGLGTPNGIAAFLAGATPPPPPATVPTAPLGLTASTASRTGVALKWSAPASNGGSPIVSYEVYRSTSSGHESAYGTVNCTTSTCSATDTGTKSRTVYYYTVAAVNAVGAGPQSNQASAKAK